MPMAFGFVERVHHRTESSQNLIADQVFNFGSKSPCLARLASLCWIYFVISQWYPQYSINLLDKSILQPRHLLMFSALPPSALWEEAPKRS